MFDFSLTLGPVAFAGFELPSSITLGGSQRLAIHRLPGGLRVIDALGSDPSDITFSGIFTGPDAGDRARLLDAMRVAGAELGLSWDAFLYTVVIERFEADYRSPWWIPYKISCTVIRDEVSAVITAAIEIAPSILADISEVGSFAADAPEVDNASIMLALPNATVSGTAAYAAAQSALSETLSSLDAQIAATEPALKSTDLLNVVSAAGSLAQLTVAKAYGVRAARNLSTAST